MISFNGMFQLVKVLKEDKTRKGDTSVFFSAASHRSDKETDFKVFKVFGAQADFMLRNLVKGNDGKYQSRKMYLSGVVETYYDNQDVSCEADIEPNDITPNIGILKQNITVRCKTTLRIQKDMYSVKHLEFADRAKDSGVEIIINNGITNSNDSVIVGTSESKQGSSAKAATTEANKEINKALSEFKDVDISEFEGSVNLEDEC